MAGDKKATKNTEDTQRADAESNHEISFWWRSSLWETEKAFFFGLRYLQLSISRVQFCSSRGYLLKSIMQAAVVVILQRKDTNRTGDEMMSVRQKQIILFIILPHKRKKR